MSLPALMYILDFWSAPSVAQPLDSLKSQASSSPLNLSAQVDKLQNIEESYGENDTRCSENERQDIAEIVSGQVGYMEEYTLSGRYLI